MKTRLGKTLFTLMIAPLLLGSCQGMDKSIEIAYNLDFFYSDTDVENVKETYFPKKLTTHDFLTMVDTKQDFVLYFYQENCASCVELATPKMKKYLSNKNTAYNIYSYDAQTFDSHILYADEKYHNLFNETPKTMFFKDGQHYMTLSEKRYTDYNLFSSAMTSFCKSSNVYHASKQIAIDDFLNTHDDFLLFFNAELQVNGETSKKPSFEFYKQHIFPKMKHAKIPTLVVSNYELNSSYKDELYKKFDLNSTTQTWAILSNQTKLEKFNYIDDTESQILINRLDSLN